MLACLTIENIAVIERARVETGAGFNVLTGETGAGKSIVIDAIHAVTGRRTSKELIRAGREKAEVSALFTDINPAVAATCERLGVPAQGGELLLHRVLHADGRSLCRVNGRPVPLALLRELADGLIDIHGQQDSRRLLDPDSHRAFLDAFAGNTAEQAAYTAAFERLKTARTRLNALLAEKRDRDSRRAALQDTVRELEAANVHPGETEALREKRRRARGGEALVSALSKAAAMLRGGDPDTPGAADLLTGAAGELERVAEFYPDAAVLAEKLTAFSEETGDIAEQLDRTAQNVRFSPEELEEIEARLDLCTRLARRYGDETEMLGTLARAKAELAAEQTAEGKISALEAESEAAKRALIDAGAALTQSRTRAAERFSAEVCDVLRDLRMPNVRFSVRMTEGTYTKYGRDRPEFLISPNLGEPPKPLAKIASGGEMSRVMLAVKSVLRAADTVDTLIFDEIDAGLSGNAAERVGHRLSLLAQSKQVLCITHLAQIAARAGRHLLVQKAERDGATYTSVEPLTGEARVKEIARMLAGGEMTQALRGAAEELLSKEAGEHDTV